MVNLLHTIGLMTRAEHEAAIREAFKAGWRTNAVGEDAHSADYLDGCEQVDFDEYRRLGIAFYIGSLSTDDVSIEPSWKDLYGLAVKENIDLEDKFKRAATDLAAQSVKAADLAAEVERLRSEIAAADRKRMAGKRGKA